MILSTSNFNCRRKISVSSTLIIGFIIVHCVNNFRDDWVRKLPPEYSKPNWDVSGNWVRITPPKSGMNSQYHKNSWGDIIEFQPTSDTSGNFQKKYWREDIYGEKVERKEFIFTGDYERSGNWILLSTHTKTDVINNIVQDFSNKLLYHYAKSENNLAPMLYESGGIENEFGILYDTKNAYAEDEAFYRARKNFTKKEFQAHAYERAR